MAEAGCAPNAHMGGDISRLGQHDIDEQYPWTQSDWTEEEITIASDWIEIQKRLGGAPANQLSGVNWQLLQGEQREGVISLSSNRSAPTFVSFVSFVIFVSTRYIRTLYIRYFCFSCKTRTPYTRFLVLT
jgi:hypothetical protein